MDKSVTHLFKMSSIVRNFTVFCRYLTVNNIQTPMCHPASKEIVTKSTYKDLSEDSSAILDHVEKNRNNLTGQTCIEALKKLSRSYAKSDRRFKKITEDEELLVLCTELDKQNKTLNSSQAIEAIELLSELGIPTKSIIIQSLSKNIQKNIDSLTEEDLRKLDRLSDKLKITRLTRTRKVNSKSGEILDREIIAMCSQLYEASLVSNANYKQAAKLLSRLSVYHHAIPVQTAKSLLSSFSRIPIHILVEFENLVKRIQDILIKNAPSLDERSVFEILDAIKDNQTNKYNGRRIELYNENLVDALITQILSNKELSLEAEIDLMNQLRSLGHFHKPLIDHVALKCFENPPKFYRMTGKKALRFVSAFTLSDYKPPFWESLQQLIIDNVNLNDSKMFTLIRITTNFVIMGSYPQELIARSLNLQEREYKELAFKTRMRLKLLYQLIRTTDPNYPGPWPSQSVLDMLFGCTWIHYPSNILQNTLSKALGGSQYLLSNVETKFGHFIDHVIVMRKGGFPIAINQNDCGNLGNFRNERKPITLIEDVVVPSESQVIAFICISSESCLRNLKQPRAHLLAYIRSLEAMDYIVVPIIISEWEVLNDRDRILLIMNHIRLKCPMDTTSSDV